MSSYTSSLLPKQRTFRDKMAEFQMKMEINLFQGEPIQCKCQLWDLSSLATRVRYC